MAYKVQKPCRVCGRKFTPCIDCVNDKSVFHWRAVTCSIDCAKEYFKRIEESRKPKNVSDNNSNENKTEKEVKEEVSSKTSIENDVKDTTVEVMSTRARRKNNKNYEESEQID